MAEAVSARQSVIRKDELKPGTKYSVYVKATTVKGDGAGSDPVILHTPSKGMLEEDYGLPAILGLQGLNTFYALCLQASKIDKPVQQFGYQWRALFAGQTINKHINMGKLNWLC